MEAPAETAKIGLVSVYFSLFDEQMPAGFRSDREAVAERYAGILRSWGEVVYPGLIASEADAASANEVLTRERPDVLVFAPSMAAPPAYAARAIDGITAPIVVWNAPMIERLARDLTQAEATVNSTQVGCVMYANTLVRSGTPFAVVTASPSRPRDVELLDRTVRACVAATKVRGQRAMRIGPWIDGYLDVETSAHDLGTIGVTERSVSREELDEAFAAVEASAPDALLAEMAGRGWERAAGANDDRSARLALALAALAERERAVMVTVNCHSDFLRWNPRIGISACLGASWLSSRGIPVSCTGDLPAAIALRLAQALSGRALYCEFYAPELETGLMLIAAGGEGDPAWADATRPIRVEPNEHYPGHNGPGASLSFRLEPGPATVLSLTPTARGWLLAWATGEVVEARYARMGGPNGMFRFDSGPADDAGARWIASGATHHNALASGRLDLELPIVARMLGLKEVRV